MVVPQHYPHLHACRTSLSLRHKIFMSNSPSPDNQKQNSLQASPAVQFSPLASTFRRRLLVGVGSASLVAVGANFAGVTSFLLGLLPETGRGLKLDVVYPIGGYSRCIDTTQGFEFIYPANWVGDQRLLYRAAEKAEVERSLDPPPLNGADRPRKSVNEPVVAFGPPGSSGELNVSVIVSPVPLDFTIEEFGGPKEVGEAIVRKITGSGRRPEVTGILVQSIGRDGRLYTLNAQAPESKWLAVQSDFYRIAGSFSLTAS